MTKTGTFFHVCLFPTNKQGGRNHSSVNQSKTIIQSTMLIQLKVKNTLKMNSLTNFIHPVKKHRQSMSKHRISVSVGRNSRFGRCIQTNPNLFWS